MLTAVEGGNAVAQLAAGIAAKVELEVLVQRVGLVHITVDDQLQVVADAAACCIDAVLVSQFCHEVWRAVHVAAIGECCTVQITVDAGTLLVAACIALAVHHQLFEAS